MFPLGLTFLTVGLSLALVYPFQTLFLTDAVHATPWQVTVFLMAAPISSVLVAAVVGNHSDRRPIRRRIIIGASVAGSTAMLLTAFVREYWVLLALVVSATALAGAVVPQMFAYARVGLAGSDRTAMAMSGLRTMFSVAWVVGPFLASVLYTVGGFTLVYGGAAATFAVTGLIAVRWLPEQDQPSVHDGESSGAGRDASRRVVLMTLAAFVLLQCVGSLSVQALPLLLTTELDGGVGAAGVILGICAGLEIPLILGFGYLSTRVPLRRLLLLTPVFAVAYTLTVAGASATWQLGAAQLLNAAAIALLQGLGVTYVQDMMPRHPGRASTWFTNTFPVGAMLAGPVLGVAQQVGYRSAYLVGAVLAVVAFVLLLLARVRRPAGAPVRSPLPRSGIRG